MSPDRAGTRSRAHARKASSVVAAPRLPNERSTRRLTPCTRRVVAVRVAPYAAEKLRAAPKPRQSTRTQGFLPRAAGPAKEVELWVTRIHVVTGERVALDLTDRARWLVGPIR